MKADAVTDEELEKAKNILLSGFYRTIKTISGRSNAIGTYEVFFGDYRKLFTAADDFAKVSKADVQRVATQYFTDEQPHRRHARSRGGARRGQEVGG